MKITIFTFMLTFFNLCLFAQTREDYNKRNYKHFGLEFFQEKDTHLYGFKKDGKVVIKPEYVYVEDFSPKGFARVRTPGHNDRPYMFYQNLYVSNEGLDGFIDTLGNVVIPIEFGVIGQLGYYNVTEFTRGYETDDFRGRSEKYGLINDKGEIILEPTYHHIAPVQDATLDTTFRAKNYIYDRDGFIVARVYFINAQGELLPAEDEK